MNKRSGRICARLTGTLAAFAVGFAALSGNTITASALTISPDFAYTEEEWESLRDNVIEFDELATRIHEFNTTVQQNVLDYQDYRGKSSSDISNEYYRSAEEVWDRISYPDDSDSNYANSMYSALNQEIQADNLVSQGDNNVDDSTTIKLQYDRTEDQLVQQAQQLMITYWTQTARLASLEESVAQAEESYRAVQVRYAAGMATQSQIDSSEEAITTAQTNLLSAQNSITQASDNLCILLGFPFGTPLEIGPVPDPDMDYINSINIEDDIQKALNNNYNIQITEEQLGNAQSSTIQETTQMSLDNQKENVSNNVRNLYTSLLEAVTDYEQAEDTLAVQQNSLAESAVKYAAGTITKNSYDTQASSVKTAEVSVETSRLSLLQAQLAYQWAVNGLASAS